MFFYANLSFALGLGDAELRSNLGERFLVNVDVTDVESAPEASCFSATDVGDPAAFRKANISLKNNANGNYHLTISTHDVISEPIVNLRVSYHCDPNVNRDYVLLLDPAPAPDKANSTQESANNTVAEPNSDEEKQPSQKTRKAKNKQLPVVESAELADEVIPEQPAVKKSSKKKRPKTLNAVDAKLLEAYTGKQNGNPEPQTVPMPESTNNTNNTDTPHKSADKPFLIISTGNTSANSGAEQPSLSLRLATEIDVYRPDEVAQAQPSATDTMDEVTVMANRLAHLEKQIASLQTRNAQLITEAQVAKEESKSFDWMQFSKFALAITLILAAIELLRRRFAKNQAKEIWFDDEPTDFKNTGPLDTNSENEFDYTDAKSPAFDEPTFTEKPAQNEEVAKAIAIAATAKEENSSVIEDADVFIEHGRPTLAIQLLQNHLSESPAESPAIWLKLLNLLSKEGAESDYDAAVIECNKYFNIKAAKFGSNPADDTSSIEDYPHIVSRLEGVWGSPYAIGFLNDMIFNKRAQPREGLDQRAFNDLFFLKNIAKNLENIDPTLFKVTPMQSVKTQAATTVAAVATTNIENNQFNDALFTDIEVAGTESSNVDRVEPQLSAQPKVIAESKKSKLKDIKRGTKSSFNQFEEVPSYEVSMLPGDEESNALFNSSEIKPEPETNALEISAPEMSPKDEPLEFDIPAKTQTTQAIEDDALFKAEEINFSIPTEKVEYATDSKPEVMTEEIVFDIPEPEAKSNQALDLEFSLDFPSEEAPLTNVDQNSNKDTLNVDEAKTKAKNKPSFKNLTESNEIEWNLPEIDIDPKSGQ